jgi:glutathione synthase/RimK-type ligase-like ATP-grasp enzyme
VRFNTEDWPTRVTLVWSSGAGSKLHLPDRHAIDTAKITAVWYRRPVAPVLPSVMETRRAEWARREAAEALDGLWRTTAALWVNAPLAEAAASSKPEQLRRATQCGLSVPETLLTNDPVEARAFASAGPTICKPLGTGMINLDGQEKLFFTTLLDASDIAALSEFGPEPYLLQRLVPKRHDLRVVVIGDETFAVAIDSQHSEVTRTDWRRGNPLLLEHQVVTLPDAIAKGCIALTREYGLAFAAIDLALDTDDRYIFFEINPSGQWAWLEQLTGLPLSARLATLLMGEK